MSIQTLLIYIGIDALILSAVVIFLLKKSKAHWMTFLQTFCGALFLFSGWVKAVDPLGTAYKMEQYFDEFYYTFGETAMGFVAPIFPLMAEYSIAFSVIMIVFELVLGINLLTGAYRKFTAWSFFLLTLFFTALTGFTYLTGYVPSGSNFFAFGDWVAHSESNMKVTDCGCFGDFIKLKPKISFFKDVFLLIPSVLFLVFNDKFFQLFSPGVRRSISWVFLVASLVYCFSNYVWDLPQVDFRPFKEGANIAQLYEAEQGASGSVQVIAWRLRNKESGQIVELSTDVYFKEMAEKYKPDAWEVIEQIKNEPTIPITKISDFEFADADGQPASQDLLERKGVTLMWVSYKLKAEYSERKAMLPDTLMKQDTIWTEKRDTFQLREVLDTIVLKEGIEVVYEWDNSLKANYMEKVVPLSDMARTNGAEIMAVVGGADQTKISHFKEDLGIDFPVHEADDILLKTIIRSNPGLVLWKDGIILKKWHIRQLPNWESIQKYL